MQGWKPRKHRRVQLTRYFEVSNAYTNQRVGFLGDISSGGLMLYADRPVEAGPGDFITLSLKLPGLGKDGVMSVLARKIWAVQDWLTSLHVAGFELEGVTRQDRHELEDAIRHLGTRAQAAG